MIYNFFAYFIFFISLNSFGYPKCIDCYNYQKVDGLGHWNIPSSTHKAKKFCSKAKLCFETTYKIDEHGLRESKNTKYKNHLIVFGGSFAFGEGLSNDEIWPEKLATMAKSNLYNISRAGAGPASLIYYFENNFQQDIPEEGIAIYYYIHDHIYRMGHRTSHFWLTTSPGYYLKDNKLVYYGKRDELPGLKPKVVNLINYLNQFEVFKGLNLSYRSFSEQELREMFISAVLRLESDYKRKYKGDFYFVVDPSQYLEEGIEKRLLAKGMRILKLRERYPNEKMQVTCSCDDHPSKEASTNIANRLYEVLYSNRLSLSDK